MIVTVDAFPWVIEKLQACKFLGLDTETTGLKFTDRLFSIVLHNGEEGYYFNFTMSPGAGLSQVLRKKMLSHMRPLFQNEDILFFAHNAKFDLSMMEKENLEVARVHCTQITERVLKNNHMKYSLDNVAKIRLNASKDTGVEEYIKAHKLYETYYVEGKKQKQTRKFFDKVPLDIISEYAIQDAKLAYLIGMDQLRELDTLSKEGKKSAQICEVYENEHKVLRVCMAMERIGIKVDRDYAAKAMADSHERLNACLVNFKTMTGEDFVDSNKSLAEIFAKAGVECGRTEKGNPSFTYDQLEKINSPLATLIIDIRRHALYARNYYGAFLNLADKDGTIHPTMRQDGTETGRFSYSDPNLQNQVKEEDPNDAYHIRRCFIPRPGFCFTAIDYNQQEFRMFLDYAGELKIIGEILNGKDVHQATADEIGCTRTQAKTINFMLLYGGGAEKLAGMLHCSVHEAMMIKKRYFVKLPGVRKLLQTIQTVGKVRGYIHSWAGRRFHIFNPDHAYILSNHLIQGGCADVVKFAMVKIFDFLKNKKSRMVCQVHDELLFEIHETELDIVDPIKDIMENIYQPQNGMLLTCSVEHSWESWGTSGKIKGVPTYETRNDFQDKISARAGKD